MDRTHKRPTAVTPVLCRPGLTDLTEATDAHTDGRFRHGLKPVAKLHLVESQSRRWRL